MRSRIGQHFIVADSLHVLTCWRRSGQNKLIGRDFTKDYKFHHADDALKRSSGNPVPPAQFNSHAEQSSIFAIDGVTRTGWLIWAGAREFPLVTDCGSADAILDLARVLGSKPMRLAEVDCDEGELRHREDRIFYMDTSVSVASAYKPPTVLEKIRSRFLG